MLLEKSGEITPERMGRKNQSENRLVVARQEGARGGMEWGVEVSRRKLLS